LTGARVDRLWYTRCPVPTASSLAIELGWLEQEFAPDGITVSSLRGAPDPDVRESHFEQRQPNSFREGGSAPALWTRSRGQDTRLLGATWVDQYQAVVVLRGSDIRSADDLRGRRLGVTAHVNDQMDFWQAKSLRGLLTALSTAGLDADDAEIVVLSESEKLMTPALPSHRDHFSPALQQESHARAEAFALIRGEVDAVYLSGARGCAIEGFLGGRRVVDLGAHPDRLVRVTNSTPTLLTVTAALVRERPDLVRRYVQCVARAADWAGEHRDTARRIIAAEVGEAEAWIDEAYGDALYTSLRPALNDELLDAVGSQKDWLLEHGFIPADFDVREWVAAEVLEGALPGP
jgi:ABC-type nitrate/sulfonate/bicarbonate transport system substrate-binding protein